MLARGWGVIPVECTSSFIGINVQLCIKGELSIGNGVVLMSQDMFATRQQRILLEHIIDGFDQVPIGRQGRVRIRRGVLEALLYSGNQAFVVGLKHGGER